MRIRSWLAGHLLNVQTRLPQSERARRRDLVGGVDQGQQDPHVRRGRAGFRFVAPLSLFSLVILLSSPLPLQYSYKVKCWNAIDLSGAPLYTFGKQELAAVSVGIVLVVVAFLVCMCSRVCLASHLRVRVSAQSRHPMD